MPKVEDIKVLNIDGVPYAVDGMSDDVKRMVDLFNEWSQKEVDVRSELAMVQAAKNDLSRNIILQVRKEKEEAEAAETAEGAEEPVSDAADADGE
jgi:hypothetical protein